MQYLRLLFFLLVSLQESSVTDVTWKIIHNYILKMLYIFLYKDN